MSEKRRLRSIRYFNSRPSARGDWGRWAADCCGRYFNSRPSARGDGYCFRRRPLLFISIHAPSARGDSACCLQVHALTAFQFTPLREGRRSSVGRRRTSPNFNSRPSARGDDVTAAKYYGVALFQFTPLREGRPGQQKAPERGDYFNSRPSARGDSALRPAARSSVSISIHAPPRGATRSYWDGTISG